MATGKTIRRVVLTAFGAVAILIAAAFLSIHTRAFANYARTKAVQAAESKLGTRVRVQSLSIPWDHLAVNVRGLTIDGRDGPPPLLEIPHLSVAIEVGPLLRGKFRLSRVVLDHAIARITVNSQGQSNLPKPAASNPQPPATSSPVDSIFSLEIAHLQIDDATIVYDDTKIPLSADLKNFNATAYFDRRADDYYGLIGYTDGKIAGKTFNPVEHSASLRFRASRSGITCNPLALTLPHSQLSLYATINNYLHPRVDGRYAAQISTTEVAQLLRNPAIPEGLLATSGIIQYDSAQGGSFWNALRLQGAANSSQLALNLRQLSASIEDFRAGYSLAGGELRIAQARARLLGGQINVTSAALSLTGESTSDLHATLTNVSIRDLGQALPAGPYDRLNLVGRAALQANLSWKSHFRDLIIASRANIYSPPPTQLTNGEIPLNGAIELAYNRALDRAALGSSRLQVGSTTISAAGVLSRNSELTLTLTADDLHQLSSLGGEIERAAASRNSSSLQIPNVRGRASFQGRAYGSLQKPQIAGRLVARDLQVNSARLQLIQTDIAVSPSRASLANGLLLLAGGGQARLDAATGLHRWSMQSTSALSLNATVANVPISDLRSLAHVQYPVAGMLSANVSVTGTKQNPAGNGWIRVTNGMAWDQPLSAVTMSFSGNADSLHAKLAVESAAGSVAATAVYHLTSKTYQVDLHAPGLKLAQLALVQARHLPLQGTLVANCSGSGAIGNPEFSMSVQSAQLTFHGQTMANFRSKLDLANHELNVTATSALYNGKLQAQGKVLLTNGYQSTATLDVHSVSVGLIAARYLRSSQKVPEGLANLHAELRGPLKNPSQLRIRAEVPAMTLEYKPVGLSLAKPLILDYHNGAVMVEESEIRGTGVDLTFAGQIPMKSSAPFNLMANGTANLSSFQGITPGFQTAGQVSLNIMAQGTLAEPNMQGNLQLQNVSLSTVSMPVDLSGLNGNIRVLGRRIEIMSLSGNVNGGSLTAQGSVDVGKTPSFNLAVSAQSVDVSYPAGVRSRVDGNLQFAGTSAASMLTGRVVIDYLGLTQQMDIASLASQFSSGGGLSSPSPFEHHVKLNIALQSSSTLSLASSQLSVQGAANLDIIGTLADPVILGRATLTGGEIFFMGKRYEVKSGTIEFANPTRTNPNVDIYATTTVNQYNIAIHFLGPVSAMKSSFTSTPALPQADIINLLAFGQTTEASATASPTPGGLGAESVLAQGVASQLSGKIQKLAGISQLSITPILASAQQDPGAQVAIQQRVSGRMLVTFTTNTAETQRTAVQVEYRLGGGLSVSVLRDQNGGYGVDLHLHKSF